MAAHTSTRGNSSTHIEGHVSIDKATRAWRTLNRKEYKYRDLESERHIRLLKMTTKNARSLPRLTIHHVSLDTAPRFEALSYCWGPSEKPYSAPIRRDRDHSLRYIPLTASLATAMIFLPLSCSCEPCNNGDQTRCSGRYIWIDQICIDQHNSDEKGHQIGLMAEIYSKATQVLVWLGPGPRHDSNLVDSTSVGSYARRTLSYSRYLQPVKIDDLSIDLESAIGIDVVRAIFKNDWFHRAWIVQESCLAADRRALIGEFSVWWGCLMSQAARSRNLTRLDISRAIFHGAAASEWKNIRKMTENKPREFCGYLARYSRRCKATDPKDKVLAFLSLWKPPEFDTKAATRAEVTVSDVYTSFARSVIEHTKRLDVLAAVNHKPQSHEGSSSGVVLPSWVPGWEYETDWTLLSPLFQFQGVWNKFDYEWDASSSRSHQHRSESPTGAELSTRGRSLWRVGWVSHQIKHVPIEPANVEKTRETLGLDSGGQSVAVSDALRILLLCRGLKRTVNYANFEPGLWGARGTALLRQCFPGAKTWSEVGCQAERVPRDDGDYEPDNALAGLGEFWDDDENALAAACDSAFHRADGKRFFQIEKPQDANAGEGGDRAGLGPGCIKTGDEIAILHGAMFPVVLRKIEGGDKKYRFIGDCYVDGVMFGESVEWEEDDADTIILV